MARFDTQIVTAKRLIERNGEASVLQRRTDGTPPDPTQPWNPGTPTTTDSDVSAVWLDYDLERVDGKLIKEGDQEVLIPGSDPDFTPDASTDILIRASGVKWSIKNVNTLAPNGQVILYTIQARQ